MNDRIKFGLLHLKCQDCGEELAVILGGLFGNELKQVKESNLKYISGCCFDFQKDYYFCEKCNKFFDKNLKENN